MSVFEFYSGPLWQLWGVGILIALPLLVVALSELVGAASRRGLTEFANSIAFVRTTCLPLLFVVLLLRKVAELDSAYLVVKIADTVFWIAVINAALALFNIVFFAEGSDSSWRPRLPKLFLDILRFFLVFLGAAVVISTVWDVDLGGLLTALGVGSIVIGLALQDTLGSLFSGIALVSARHFKEGDWIKVGDEEGVVTSMNWRSVTIRAREGDFVILPNTVLAKERFRNIGAVAGWHGEKTYFKLAYEHPPETVKALILEAARATDGILDTPPPQARLHESEDYAIRYQALVFIENYQRLPVVMSDFRSLFWYMAERDALVFPARHNRLYGRPAAKPAGAADRAADLGILVGETGALPRSAEDLAPLLVNARRIRFRKGENIVTQDRPARGLYIVTEGTAVVTYQRNGSDDIEVDEFGRGQLVLFKSLLRGDASPLTVAAASDVVAVMVPADDLLDFLQNDPALGVELEHMISEREEAADRVLAAALPGHTNGADKSDRIQILQDLFRS